MSRGRPRKFDPSIPAHIDQRKIPKGVYWDARYRFWYTKVNRSSLPIAKEKATLADLHTAIERIHADGRGTLGWLMSAFEESNDFKALSPATQRDYRWCRSIVVAYQGKNGTTLSTVPTQTLSQPIFRTLLDRFQSEGAPAKGNHVLRYLRRTFSWGIEFGHCKENPARGVKALKEKGRFKMPTPAALTAVLAFAQERGQLTAHAEGSVSPYLWPFIVIAYRCRLRKVEVVTMKEGQIDDIGIITDRRKGSLDNHVRWSDDLREAVAALRQHRDTTWAKRKAPIPMRHADRPLFVTITGSTVSESTLDSAWARLMEAAIEEGIITPEERFTPHGLKHRGITDSADKGSGGHVTEKMRRRYDHEVPVVEPAGKE